MLASRSAAEIPQFSVVGNALSVVGETVGAFVGAAVANRPVGACVTGTLVGA